MSPTGQLLPLAGNQRIMMHSYAKQLQAPFATQRVIDGQNNRGIGCHKAVDNQRQKLTRDLIERPLITIKEAVEVAPRTLPRRITGHNRVADESSSLRQDPTGYDRRPQLETGSPQDRAERLHPHLKTATQFHR
jgi:hypothetical protein